MPLKKIKFKVVKLIGKHFHRQKNIRACFQTMEGTRNYITPNHKTPPSEPGIAHGHAKETKKCQNGKGDA